MRGSESVRPKFLALLPVLLMPMATHAMMLEVNSEGQLTGATGVDVGGTFWDVVFSDGDWDFSSGLGLPASTKEEADLFGQALLDQVFVDSSLGLFDSDPELTNGCENTQSCSVFIPYLVEGTSTTFAIATNQRIEGIQDDFIRELPITLGVTGDFGDVTTRVLGEWTLSATQPPVDPPSPVFEPGTLTLLGIGLAGIGFARRRPTV